MILLDLFRRKPPDVRPSVPIYSARSWNLLGQLENLNRRLARGLEEEGGRNGRGPA